MRILALLQFIFFIGSTSVSANPYWDPEKVPKDAAKPSFQHAVKALKTDKSLGLPVLRIQLDWNQQTESYSLKHALIENSGTKALLARAKHKPALGSYLGKLQDAEGNIYYDSIGTGKEYRKLTKAISFRFPLPKSDMVLTLYAEHPYYGVMEKVFEYDISVANLQKNETVFPKLEVKELVISKESRSLRVNIYAEGYSEAEKDIFFGDALRTAFAMKAFPGAEYMSFYAVFHPSNKLGKAKKLGFPVPEFDSFTGLYFPYWDDFGRWYHVLYPTRENKFREALSTSPYDYPFVLVNDSNYWGVGNYMSHVAIPAHNGSFNYLLNHEVGHFFGLNEEYSGGGRTELEFAVNIEEPWSQNITFLKQPDHENLKWNEFVDAQTPIPTPNYIWDFFTYGAYKGGYADSEGAQIYSHIPGFGCVMSHHEEFCKICAQGIRDVIMYSLGG